MFKYVQINRIRCDGSWNNGIPEEHTSISKSWAHCHIKARQLLKWSPSPGQSLNDLQPSEEWQSHGHPLSPFFRRFTVLLVTLVSSFAMFHRFTTSPALSRMLWKRLPKPNWQPKPRSWDGWPISSSISLKTQTSTTSNLTRPQWSDVSSKLGHLLCGI